MKRIVICTTPTCPRCEEVKDFLRKKSLTWEEIDISTAEGLTSASVDEGIYTREAPVVKIDNTIIYGLFASGKFKSSLIEGLL